MEVKVHIHDYKEHGSLTLEWEPGFEVQCLIQANEVVIQANREGLISLARHLLTLAQENVPVGHHLHFDDLNALEEGSIPIIIEKMEKQHVLEEKA